MVISKQEQATFTYLQLVIAMSQQQKRGVFDGNFKQEQASFTHLEVVNLG
jgi:hypothetical protein